MGSRSVSLFFEMCGIAGAILTDTGDGDGVGRPLSGSVFRLVERMSEAQSHRGPDGSGLWRSRAGEVVFAHRRLAILDLSEAGAQPMIDAESGCAITFNGEIYNFVEIRRELESLGESFSSSSDTEVVLKALKRWGAAAVRRFRGIFALALWDPRAREVHLVRDPMGIKPLYWTTVRDDDSAQDVVLFASELRALLASGAVARRLDPAGVASYLWHGFVVGPTTMIEGVQLLPAASILTICCKPTRDRQPSRQLSTYWHIPLSSDRTATVDEVRSELRNTVRMQLVADVPLGVFLSGGIDSSALASQAIEVAEGPVHTFTVGFDVAGYDESRYAERVADAIKSHHTTIVLTERDFDEQLGDAFKAIDQPTFDGINTYFVSRAARDAGMTVALAGTGGDEIFGGYRSFADLPRALRAGAWLPSREAFGIARTVIDWAVVYCMQAGNALWWDVLEAAPPQVRWGKIGDALRAVPDILDLYQVFYALFTRESQATLADAAVRQFVSRQEYGLPSEVASAWRQRIRGRDVLDALSTLELSSFAGERLLRDTDAASMAVALEVRVPLLDHVFLEVLCGVEAERRYHPVGQKQLLRDVALHRIAPTLFERPKAGFVLPIDSWARSRLKPQIEAVLSEERLARRVGLRSGPLRTLWKSFVDQRPGIYWSRIWALYVLMAWCERHDVRIAGE